MLIYFLQPHSCPAGLSDRNGSCTAHDAVDIPLCFTDTAILYVVCIIMWLMAGLEFCFTSTRHPQIPINSVSISKLVRGFEYYHVGCITITNCNIKEITDLSSEK